MKYCHKNGFVLTKIEEYDLSRLKNLKDESWFGTHKISIVNMADQKKWLEKTSSLVLKALIDAPPYDNSCHSTVTSTVYSDNSVSFTNVPEQRFVGIFKIDNIDSVNRSCDVGWDIFSSERGSGYGKKLVQAGVDFCFEVLNINRLDAEILENNIASQKCAVNAGFVLEGNRRKAVFKCIEYIDSFVYGILRSEWDTGSIRNNSYLPKDGSKK